MKIIKNRVFALILLILPMVFTISCIKDLRESADELSKINKVKFNPEFALPLINSNLSLSDLVKRVNSDLIYEDENQLLHVIYRGELFTIEAQDFVEIEDQETELTFNLSQFQVDQLNNNGSVTMNLEGFVNYNLSDIELDSMLTKVCRNLMSISSDLEHDISLKVEFPDVKKNGQAFEINASAAYQGTTPVEVAKGQDLQGYLFDLTKANKAFNQLKIKIELKITKNGNNPASTSDDIRFKSGFYFNEFQVLWGYVGQRNIAPSPDTVSLNLFNSSDNGTFTITDPRIKLYVKNSFGIPVDARVKKLSAYIPSQGEVDITGIPDPLPIPNVSSAEMGQTKIDSVVLDGTTSNFATIINNRPHRFNYDFDAEVNPMGSNYDRNFIMDTSKMEFAVDIDIPLDGTAKDFGMEKEQSFELDIESIEELDYAIIRIALDNSFPMEFGFQVVFLDSMGNRLDSLVDDQLLRITSAVVNDKGEVISPGTSVHDIRIDQMRLDNISKAKTVLLSAAVTTPSYQGNQVPVKFYSNQKIDFRLGIQLKAKIDSEL